MWLKCAQLNSSVSGNPLGKVATHDFISGNIHGFNEPRQGAKDILATMWESSGVQNFLFLIR